MITRDAVRIAVVGVIAAAALGAGLATTAHHPSTGTVSVSEGSEGSVSETQGGPHRRPIDTEPACPNCFG
jgi:hypothetical protein